MMLPKAFSPDDYTAMLTRLRAENDFVAKLNTFIVMPKNQSANDEEDSDDGAVSGRKDSGALFGKAVRAQTVTELQERLRMKMAELRGDRDEAKSKSKKIKLSKAERKKKAKEAKKLMNKIAQAGKNGNELLTAAKAAGGSPVKPVYNNEGKMVFSKFDFSEEQTEKKPKMDPKSALQKIQKQKEKIHSLASDGNVEKARRLESNVSWGAALAKAEGVRVKDDVSLLKKSIKKKDQRKKSSKKKWEGRENHVESKKVAVQQRRTGNIQKRKEEKKKHKNKKAVKKGRLIPGFG